MMSLNTVEEIEQAIGLLTPQDLDEFSAWFDRYQHPLDARIEADLSAGNLDGAIQRALDDEQAGHLRRL